MLVILHEIKRFFKSKQSLQTKNIKREIAMKVSKAHVPPIWDENVCDSTNGKQIFVRFAITISTVVRTLQVTRLLHIGLEQYAQLNIPT